MNKIYFSSKALIVSNQKVLVLKGIYDGEEFWDLPGGSLEYGETAEQALIREVKEEICVTVKPVKLIDTWNYFHHDYQVTGVVYLCDVDSTEFVLSSEHTDFEWIRIEELEQKIHQDSFLERIRKWRWGAVLSRDHLMVDI